MMNERIIELVTQADKDFQLALVPAEIVEKFAALIVQECAEVMKDSQWSEAGGEYYVGFNEALNYGAIKIKKHFGIK